MNALPREEWAWDGSLDHAAWSLKQLVGFAICVAAKIAEHDKRPIPPYPDFRDKLLKRMEKVAGELGVAEVVRRLDVMEGEWGTIWKIWSYPEDNRPATPGAWELLFASTLEAAGKVAAMTETEREKLFVPATSGGWGALEG